MRSTCVLYLGFEFFSLLKQEVGEGVKFDSGPEIKSDTHKRAVIGGKVS